MIRLVLVFSHEMAPAFFPDDRHNMSFAVDGVFKMELLRAVINSFLSRKSFFLQKSFVPSASFEIQSES